MDVNIVSHSGAQESAWLSPSRLKFVYTSDTISARKARPGA